MKVDPAAYCMLAFAACGDGTTQGALADVAEEMPDEVSDAETVEPSDDADFCGATTVLGFMYAAPPDNGWVLFSADGRLLRNDQDAVTCTLTTYVLECSGTGTGVARVAYCDNGEKELEVPFKTLDDSTVELFGVAFHREAETTIEHLVTTSCGSQTSCRMNW